MGTWTLVAMEARRDTGEVFLPWGEDVTGLLVYSATKGLAAMTLAIAHSRGWLDYEERVARYWPEFAQHGKETITVRQLLAHQAGLFAFDEPVSRDVVADLDRLAIVLARQKPTWERGTRQAYHALTLGFYEGELLRRVDPQHRGGTVDETGPRPSQRTTGRTCSPAMNGIGGRGPKCSVKFTASRGTRTTTRRSAGGPSFAGSATTMG